jgi:hypothetical protein
MEPNWKPLKNILPMYCNDFMIMGTSGNIILYKNRNTRKYIYIDEKGTCYHFFDSSYIPVSKEAAIAHAFQ